MEKTYEALEKKTHAFSVNLSPIWLIHLSISLSNSFMLTKSAPTRAVTTISYPPSGIRERSSDRNRRLTRLRTTAEPTRLPTESANRLWGRPFWRAATFIHRCRARFPLRSVALISELRRSRSSAAGTVTLPAPPGYSASRERPDCRRRRITARPPRVAIRARKPCFRLRGMRFGCHVLFGTRVLHPRRATRPRAASPLSPLWHGAPRAGSTATRGPRRL